MTPLEVNSWMPENPYPGGYDKQDTVRSAFEEGRDQGFEDGCQQTALKLVEWLDGYCQDHWTLKDYRLRDDCEECWEQLRKDVGL